MDELREIIIEKIKHDGPITFHDYMELALYHPARGYYNRTGEKIGKLGDFYTAANVSEFYGQTIAEEIRARRRKLDHDVPFSIVEFGAGTGQLAVDILNYLENFPDFKRIRYVIVEKSSYFLGRQVETLSRFEEHLVWSAMGDLLASPVTGVLLQSEVIDAFAVHRIIFTGGEFKEIYVNYQRKFIEDIGPLSIPFLADYLEKYAAPFSEGQQGEINLKALKWLEDLASLIDKGFIITIDYGGEAGEIYSPMRHGGTLACYYKHQLSDNPYERLGEQDITSHVNFTALIRRGEELGLKKVFLQTQADFLMSNGLMEKLDEKRRRISGTEKIKLGLAIKNLILPQGMGERFKVLVQEKGFKFP